MIVGWDISGVVTESNSRRLKEGDEVFGMLDFQGEGVAYAEFVVAHGLQVVHKLKAIGHEKQLLHSWQL